MKNPCALLSIAAILLIGCGGNSGSSNDSRSRYTGTFGSTTTSTQGTLDLAIAPDGTITGTTTDTRFSGRGTVQEGSRLESNGATTLIVKYGTSPGVTKTAQGSLQPNGSSLTGTLTENSGDSLESFSYTLTPK